MSNLSIDIPKVRNHYKDALLKFENIESHVEHEFGTIVKVSISVSLECIPDLCDRVEELEHENESLRANEMIHERIIANSHNPIQEDKMVHLILDKNELEQKIEKLKSVCKSHIQKQAVLTREYNIAYHALELAKAQLDYEWIEECIRMAREKYE